jgi:hypothetical protein
MKLEESKLFYAPIAGLRLRPILESWVAAEHEAVMFGADLTEKEKVLKAGSAIVASIIKWKDKDKAEKLFFEHVSYEGYGKLDNAEVQEKILKDFGLLSLTNILALCWIEYLGKSLAGSGDPED